MLRIFSISCLLLLLPLILSGQTENASEQFSALGGYYKNAILLRWAPKETWTFEMALKDGYRIERAEFSDLDYSKAQFKLLQIVLPFPKKGLENRVDTTDINQLIAAEIAHGKKGDSLRRTPIKNPTNPDEIVERNAHLQNRRFYGLVAADYSFRAAEILGLGYQDSTVEIGKMYLYRISIIKAPKGILPDTVYLSVASQENSDLIYLKLKGDNLENKVRIHWAKDEYSRTMTGFYINKSTDRKTFNRINNRPFKPLNSKAEDDKILQSSDSSLINQYFNYYSYSDSLKENYKPNYYTIEGIDVFGIVHSISDTIQLMGKDLTPPEPVYKLKTSITEEGLVRLDWEAPTYPINEKVEYYVERSAQTISGVEFDRISGLRNLSSGTKYFTDKSPITSKLCYYRVISVDTVGNESISAPWMYAIEDLTPPENPKKIRAVLDTTGTLTVNYSLSESSDAFQYLFYYAFKKEDEFIPFDSYGSIDSVFIYKNFPVRQLNKHFFIRVITIDRAGNMSLPSNAIFVEIPDVIPPLTPTLQKAELRDNVLFAQYEKCGSNDIKFYQLQRSIENKTWQTVKIIDGKNVTGNNIEIQDTISNHGVYHRIRLIAVDESQLQSLPSEYAEGRLLAKERSKPCSKSNVIFNKQLKQIELKWQHVEGTYTKYLIHRKINNGRTAFLGSTSGISYFIDRNISVKGQYTYILIAVTDSKGESNPTEISIEINL